jgi:uncharacterized protein (TIGR03118 family)
MITKKVVRRLAGTAMVAGAVISVGLSAVTASAATPSRFTEVDLVSDHLTLATPADSDLVNPWGLALSPTSPLWVANNGQNIATLYAGGGTGPVVKNANTHPVVNGRPTGQVFNDTANDFLVVDGDATTRARFIFATESGTIAAWYPALGNTTAVKPGTDGAIYKSLALWHTTGGNFLLAGDFHNGKVDVFDSAFHPVPAMSAPDFFTDPDLPAGYAPFNIMTVGVKVYVSYARQDADAEDEVAGVSRGFVDLYTDGGRSVHRIASHGTLNAPWGMAIAPASFGSFAGALLVGNFGDGRIGGFTDDGHFLGLLKDANDDPIAIDGLWALQQGTAAAGSSDWLWFSAGPDDETHGLLGQIRPAS